MINSRWHDVMKARTGKEEKSSGASAVLLRLESQFARFTWIEFDSRIRWLNWRL
jgi:hypothetical protein